MRSKNNSYKTLAIVGNGFDLAHDYSTGYNSFAEKTDSHSLDVFKSFCDEEESIVTWFMFEENIRILTGKLFQQNFDDRCNFKENQRQMQTLRETFQNIHELLLEYLAEQISLKPFKPKDSIKRFVDSNTIALNFNYTPTFENYTENVIYVHGSLKEKDILLGYDYRDEPCLAGYDDVYWSKNICRENLAFRRYLRNDKGHIDDSKRDALIKDFAIYQKYAKSSRGIDNEVKESIALYEEIQQILKSIKPNNYPDIAYNDITTVVVLGHGIEADRVYLERILKECINIEKVIIFRYEGESDKSFNEKVKFFNRFCKEVQEEKY